MDVSKGHGRLETRKLTVSRFLPNQGDDDISFPFVNQAFRIERTIEYPGGKTTCETVYAITSLPRERANPRQLLELNRGHWAIEANHYVRDVTMDEDRSRVRKGSGPQVMATLWNLTIGVIRLAGGTSIAAGLRGFGWGPRSGVFRLLGAN